MGETDLKALADTAVDEASFIAFLGALKRDRRDDCDREKCQATPPFSSSGSGWNNASIEEFLDAAIGWASDTKSGAKYYSVPENPWTRCAQILLMGKMYE